MTTLVPLSGPQRERTRARAAVLGRLATTSAHLTTSAEGQGVEDRIERLAASHGRRAAAPNRASFAAIDAALLELSVSTDEWDILYRLRLQVERDLLAGNLPGISAGAGTSPA